MYHYAGLLAVLLAALVTGVRSDAAFVLPPSGGPAYNYQDNPEYKVGKTISVEWTSDLSSMDIVIWQQYPAAIGQGFVRLVDHTTRLSIDWTVSLDGFNTSVAKGQQVILYMGMYETGATDLAATSHYFNVSVPDSLTSTAATTSATETGTSTRTSTSAASATTTTGAETTSATSEPKSDDSGLSTGAVAGIGVGSAVVGIAAFSGLAFFFWKRHRRATAGGQYTQSQQSPPPDEVKTHELASSGWNHAPPQQPLAGPVTGPTGLYEAP